MCPSTINPFHDSLYLQDGSPMVVFTPHVEEHNSSTTHFLCYSGISWDFIIQLYAWLEIFSQFDAIVYYGEIVVTNNKAI